MAKRKRADTEKDALLTATQPSGKAGKLSKAAAKGVSQPSPVLLDLVHTFLKNNDLPRAAKALTIDWRIEKSSLPFNGAARGLPRLVEIYELWSKQQKPGQPDVNLAPATSPANSVAGDSDESDKSHEGTGSSSESPSESDSESEARSESGSSSSDDESSGDDISSTYGVIENHRLVAKSASSSSSSSDTSSDSETSSKSKLDAKNEQKTRKSSKVGKGDRSRRADFTDQDSSSDSSRDSESDSSVDSSKKSKVKASSSESNQSDSASDSDSTSETSESGTSSDESSDIDRAPKSGKHPPKLPKPSRTEPGQEKSDSNASASSSTLKGSPAILSDSSKFVDTTSAKQNDATSLKRKRDAQSVNPIPNNPEKRTKHSNEPFRRIPQDLQVDPRFSSNKYVSYDYADRAHRDLSTTKGKGFTKEKNKKKRGSYKGGFIDTTPKGIKFED